jgi:translation initiation factor IF-2
MSANECNPRLRPLSEAEYSRGMSELPGRDLDSASEPRVTTEQRVPAEEPAAGETASQMAPSSAVQEPEAPELAQPAAPEVAPDLAPADEPVPAQEAKKSKKGKKGKAKKAKSSKGKAKKAKKKGKKDKKK